MHTRIQKWGNSQGLRLTRAILDEVNLAVDDEVDIKVQDGSILIVPSIRIRGKYSIECLVAEIPSDYKAEKVDWGEPEGREEW